MFGIALSRDPLDPVCVEVTHAAGLIRADHRAAVKSELHRLPAPKPQACKGSAAAGSFAPSPFLLRSMPAWQSGNGDNGPPLAIRADLFNACPLA